MYVTDKSVKIKDRKGQERQTVLKETNKTSRETRLGQIRERYWDKAGMGVIEVR